MKYFVTFLLAMLPLAAFGQSVSRTELRSTNTLIDARMAQKAPTNSPTLFTPTFQGAATFQGGTNTITSSGAQGQLTLGAQGADAHHIGWWPTGIEFEDSDTGLRYLSYTNAGGEAVVKLTGDAIILDTPFINLPSISSNTAVVSLFGKDDNGNLTETLGLGRALIKTVAGVGGAGTNFTFTDGEYQVNGKTNTHIVAIMGGEVGVSKTCLVLSTNRTPTARTVSVSSVTNNWIPIGALSFPQSTTNSALWMSAKVRGSNVFYALQHVANPTD